jgi:hypothetical protein
MNAMSIYFIKTLWTMILAHEKQALKWSLVYMLNKTILYTPNSLQHVLRRNIVLECDSRSYGCSMISRLVWMNLDTQDTCNTKQVPSPVCSIWHIQLYNCTIIYQMLPSQVRILSQHHLGESLYKTPTWGSIEPIPWTPSTPSCNQWWSATDL